MRTLSGPSGPKGHLLGHNLREYSRDPLGFLSRCAREYGDIVRLRFMGQTFYLLSHPDLIEYVLIGSFVSIGALLGATALGTQLDGWYTRVADWVELQGP